MNKKQEVSKKLGAQFEKNTAHDTVGKGRFKVDLNRIYMLRTVNTTAARTDPEEGIS